MEKVVKNKNNRLYKWFYGSLQGLFFDNFTITAFFWTFSLFFFLYFKIDYFPSSFVDKVMGEALLFGVDAAKRVKIFYLLFFVVLPAFLILIRNALNKFFSSISEYFKKELNLLSTVGTILIVISLISKLQNEILKFFPSFMLILEMEFLIFFFHLINKKIPRLNLENIDWIFTAIIPFLFITSLSMSFIEIKYCHLIFFAIFGVGSIILFLFSNLKKINIEALKKANMFFMLAPIFESLYLELYNILNQYNIIISRKILIIFLIYICCFLIAIFVYFINKDRKNSFNYKKYYYPLLIILFSLFAVQLNLINEVNTDLFESANAGESIFEFFKFGKIPLLETFDAHMLQHQMWGILYGIINNDISGAIFCQYVVYASIFTYLVIYYFLNKFFSKDISFLIVLFFPLTFDLTLWNFAFCFIPILLLIQAYQKKTLNYYFLFWISLIGLCLYALDLGTATTFAGLIMVLYLLWKNKSQILKSFFSLFALLIIFLGIFLILCYFKNINPILRIVEFLKIALSNINWAYSGLGSTSKLTYIIYYFLFPIFMVLSLLFLILKNKENKTINSIILLFLNLIYLFNFQRGLIRHSLIENNYYTGAPFFFLYFSLFLYEYMFKNGRVIKFILTYGGIILFAPFLVSGRAPIYTNLMDNSVKRYTSFTVHKDKATEKVTRFPLSNMMENEIEGVIEVLNTLLNKNETFLDFTNQTLLYALSGKEKPVYINQSPGLLSGEKSQRLFLKEIKEFYKNIPIALKARNKNLSTTLDQIPNDYRYFLISEEIFKNYEPIAIINDYEIWVIKDKTKEFQNKIANIENIELISENDYINMDIKNVDLKYLPYIWGYDIYSQNFVERTFENNSNSELFLDDTNIDKSSGNYIVLNIESAKNNKVTLDVYSDKGVVQSYTFIVLEGAHNYYIRLSTSYVWYKGVNKLSVVNDDPNQTFVKSMALLKGD